MNKHRRSIFRLAIFAIAFLAFARLTACQFTWWDDQETIHQNPRLNPPTWETLRFYWTTAGEHTTMGLYVPVTYTVWSGLAKIAQMDHPDSEGLMLNAAVFHTANVGIHAMTAVLVFELLMALFAGEWPAAGGALLFALHPVQVESVGWISGTKDLLCGFFAIAALLMYVRSVKAKSRFSGAMTFGRESDSSASDFSPLNISETGQGAIDYFRPTRVIGPRRRSRWRYLLGIVFFILAILSKPTAVVTPLMAATIAIFIVNCPARQTLVSLTPWFVLMIPCVIWTKLVQPASWSSPLPLWARPAVAADAIAFYLCKLVLPIHLCIDYGHNPQAIVDEHLIYFTWIFPLVLTGILWRNAQRHRPAIAAAILFVLPLVPVLGFVGFEFQLISTTSDHYLYLPMLGAAVAAAWILTRTRSPTAFTAWIAILIALCVRSIAQEPVWQNSRTLFNHALTVNPRSVVCSDEMGFITGRDARRSTDPVKARALLEESVRWYQRSLSAGPDSVPSIYNLALDYAAIGQLDKGRALMHHIIELQSQLPPGLRVDPIDLANRLYNFPDVQGAVGWLDRVIRDDPRNVQAMVLRQRALDRLSAEQKNRQGPRTWR